MTIEIRQVKTAAEHDLFYRFPWKHYADEPHWIPDLPSIRRELLDKNHAAAWEYLRGEYFLAYENGELVGTVGAVVNPLYNEHWGENIGFFGMFEAPNKPEVAAALLTAAENYLRGQGVTAIRGPVNFTIHEPIGVLIEGFEYDPMTLTPYNYPYYDSLIAGCGYGKAMDLSAWRLDLQGYIQTENAIRLKALAEKAMEKRGLSFRFLDMKNKARDLELVKELYNDAWSSNWGFTPMTDREKDELVKQLGQLVSSKDIVFGIVNGELAAFALLAPNFNEVLKHVDAHPDRPDWWWLLKTGWHWKIRPKITTSRLTLVGVREKYRNAGTLTAAMWAMLEANHDRYEWTDCSWLLETNREAEKLLAHAGYYVYKRYRVYQKAL